MPPALPLKIARLDACYVITDAGGLRLAYVYFEDDPARAIIQAMMPEAEAREVAKAIARALTADAGGDGAG